MHKYQYVIRALVRVMCETVAAFEGNGKQQSVAERNGVGWGQSDILLKNVSFWRKIIHP